MPEVSIVVPCFNEEGNLEVLHSHIQAQMGDYSYELIFINDGSTDNTIEEIQRICKNDPVVKYISFSRNFGHQNAIKAGLDHANGQCVIMMDADLQHPPELIPSLINLWKQGHDIVYTIRNEGGEISFFKKLSAKWFYRFMHFISDIDLHQNAADFRLLDKKVVKTLKSLPESDLFWRGLSAWVGYKSIAVPYTAGQRYSGETKYSLAKMFSFALKGITSFSTKPLRIASIAGALISMLAALYGLYALLLYAFTDKSATGWTSILLSILFIGGLQLLTLGIIGEYLGKLFMQAKNRPTYIIKDSSYE